MKTYYSNHFYPELQCKEHEIISALPCPWPSCKNGCSDDKFKQPDMFEGKEPTIYSRIENVYPNGDIYYSWRGNKVPSWLSLNETIWNEFRRYGLVKPMEDSTYHYTSLEGFMSIVETNSLWMTDYTYLNDKKELTYGIDRAISLIDSLNKSNNYPKGKILFPKWKESLSSFRVGL